jgi:alanyl-tRNA synthetase
VALKVATEILGVRAVFGETYPDPVRVVSVGVSVEDLLKDVKSPEWQKVSIEFCGGTHVANTSEVIRYGSLSALERLTLQIKELIIMEESGIAKGIRRIIAVTGQDAYDAQRKAKEFAGEFGRLEQMPFSAEKEEMAKQCKSTLDQLQVSALDKSRFRVRYEGIAKKILAQQVCRLAVSL